MRCVNPNHPEYKKLVSLMPFIDPDLVELAVYAWQNHYDTDRFPSSSEVRTLVRNRESYNYMGAYLSARNKPIGEGAVDQAMKNLPERVNKIQSVLTKLVPGIKIKIHDNEDNYRDEVAKVNNGKYSVSNGFYNPKTKEIHLNVNQMLRTMSDKSQRALNAAEHEAIHPLLETIEMIKPGTIEAMYNQLSSIENIFGLRGKYTVGFAGKYSPENQKEEAVTEFLADIASGNLDIKIPDIRRRNRLIEILGSMFDLFGLDIRPLLKGKDIYETERRLLNFARDIQSAFDQGKQLDLKFDGIFEGKIKYSLAERDSINRRAGIQYLEQLKNYIKTGLYQRFNLGVPSEALLAAGIPDLPIELKSDILKAKEEKHRLNVMNLSNLPEAIAYPLAVFQSATVGGNKVILTELVQDDKNIVVALEINKETRSNIVNDIRSIYPRDSYQVVKWINENLLEYAQKEKILEWLNKQRFNSAEVTKQGKSQLSEESRKSGYSTHDIKDATNIIQNHENKQVKFSKSEKIVANEEQYNVYLQKVRDYGKEIEGGLAVYERFSSEEQRGLTEGGRAHVEAAIIAGRSVGARETQDRKNNRQEKDIAQYAKREGIWIGPKELQKKYGDPINSGKESLVYYDKSKGIVIKTSNTLQFRTLEEAMDGITLHNTYFPETALKVIGFGKSGDGEFQIITEQPYVKEAGSKLSQEEITVYLGNLGFEKHEDGLSHNYKNDNVLLRDMHPENLILTPEGNIVVIDTIMRLNTADLGFGGKREQKSSPIKFQLEDEKEKNRENRTTDEDGVSYLHESSGDYGTRSDNVQRNRNTSDLFGNRRTIKSVWNKFKNLQFTGTTKVENAADVAEIMKLLENKSVEHGFAIHVDEKGNSHIQFLSVGGATATVIDPKLVLAGVNKFQSKKVYLVHNHPTGNMQASRPDLELTKNIRNGLEPFDISLEHIIMDTYKNEYVVIDEYNDQAVYKRQDTGKKSKKLNVHIIDEQEIIESPIGNVVGSNDAFAAIQQLRFTAMPKNGVLVLNASNQIIGNYFFTDGINEKELLQFAGDIPTSIYVILYGNQNINANEIKRKIKLLGFELLDYVIIDSNNQDVKDYYKSMSDLGLLNEHQAKYNTNSVNEYNKNQNNEESKQYLEEIVNSKNEINYGGLEKIWRTASSGGIRIGRLNRREEQGRIEGGRVHVEASAIIEAKARTERPYRRTNKSYSEHKQEVKIYEDLLESYARNNGIWYEDYSIFENEYGYYDRGVESEVYFDKDNEDSLIKTMGYDFQKQQSPQDFLDRLTLHNALFPDTKYELVGFTKDKSGYFRFVTRQKFIIGDVVSVEDRVKYMQEKLDIVPVDEANETFKNTNYVIKDLHSKNVLGNNGILYFIDPIVHLNLKEDNEGGIRELDQGRYNRNAGDIRFSLADDKLRQEAIAYVEKNIEKLVNDYLVNEGNKIDPDKAREIFNTMGYNGSNVPIFREAEKKLVYGIYNKMLNDNNKSIVFLTGTGGSGKTNVTKNLDFGKKGIIFDSAFNSFEGIDKVIKKAKENGFDIEVIQVYNDPITAFTNTISRGKNTNRFLGLSYFVDAFIRNNGKLKKIINNYPEIKIIPIDNSGNNVRQTTLEKAKKWNYDLTEAKIYKLLKIFENEISTGAITGDQAASIGDKLSEITETPRYRTNRVGRIIDRINGSIFRIRGGSESSEVEETNRRGNSVGVRLTEEENKNDIKFSFVGEEANLNREIRNNLQVARIMEREMELAEQYWEDDSPETKASVSKISMASGGWQRGKDGKWRLEIADGRWADVEKILEVMLDSEEKTLTFDEVLDYPELLELYPEAEKLKFKFITDEKTQNKQGRYNSKTRTIDHNRWKFQNYFKERDRLSIRHDTSELRGLFRFWVLHELAHFIQDIEGFSKGGDPSVISDSQALKLAKQYGIDYENLGLEKVKIELYRRLAGETEARNVSARHIIENREQILYSDTEDVSREDQIINFTNSQNNVSIYNDHESLKGSEYIEKGGQTREILKAVKTQESENEHYIWNEINKPNAIYKTWVRSNGSEKTVPVSGIKFSLFNTENENTEKSPYQEAIDFGRLVSQISDQLKEGEVDKNVLRNKASADIYSLETFDKAYDMALVRNGNTPVTPRQKVLSNIIKQNKKGDDRFTAQKMWRLKHPLLEHVGIDQLLIKQILPDEGMIKDKDYNQTWRRLLNVVDDVGRFVSHPMIQGQKFELQDQNNLLSTYDKELGLAFSDMLGIVQTQVEADPENKEKLLKNVREALSNETDDAKKGTLEIMELAIAASGDDVSINDLSKIIVKGTIAGRILNVIKHYIGGGNFGKVRLDMIAAKVLADNDVLIAEYDSVHPDANLLNQAEAIREVLTNRDMSEMTEAEMDELFNDNPSLLSRAQEILREQGESKGKTRKATDAAKAKRKISMGVNGLKALLQRTSPESIRFSKAGLDASVAKQMKVILRGLIDLHGTNKQKLQDEMDKVLNTAGISMDTDEVFNDQSIQEYIINYNRHKIRSAVIESMGIGGDNYSKMILGKVLVQLGENEPGMNKVEALVNALDRGEITKELLDAVRNEIAKNPDEEERTNLLDRLDNKMATVVDGAVSKRLLTSATKEALGSISKELVMQFMIDPEKNVAVLTAKAMDQMGLSPEQAEKWAEHISKIIRDRMIQMQNKKVKAIVSQRVNDKVKQDDLTAKILKIITGSANKDGSFPTDMEIDGIMFDIKKAIAEKHGIQLNDPKAVAHILHLTQLLKNARSQARREQLQQEILLKVRNLKLSPNKYMRVFKSGINELGNFIMYNILDGLNTAYKAVVVGFYNFSINWVSDLLSGKLTDVVYKGKELRKRINEEINKKGEIKPTSHAMLSASLFVDAFANGSAAVSQTNIPEDGLSNIDRNINRSTILKLLYAPFRVLNATDIATMTLAKDPLKRKLAIEALMEFGVNNVSHDGSNYSRTAGGASWYKVDGNNNPEISDKTGNVITVDDPATIKILNEKAKQNPNITAFILEAEKQLGYGKEQQIYDEIIKEWNSLVELHKSTTASEEDKSELKALGLHRYELKPVTKMEDFKNMSLKVRTYIAGVLNKKVSLDQNAAMAMNADLIAGGYSAQSTRVGGMIPGLLYYILNIPEAAIKKINEGDNLGAKLVANAAYIPFKIFATLITRAPMVGLSAQMMMSPFSLAQTILDIMLQSVGKQTIKVSYDTKDRAWRFNGLTIKELRRATGIQTLEVSNLYINPTPAVKKILKEGYTTIVQERTVFEAKEPQLVTIGGHKSNSQLISIMTKQMISSAAFLALAGLMFDCEEDDCELSETGKWILSKVTLKGYGKNRNYLDQGTWINKVYGLPSDRFKEIFPNTVGMKSESSPIELKVPIGELNNGVTVMALARTKDMLDQGIKVTKEDLLMNYLWYAQVDLLQQTTSMNVEGMSELLNTMTAVWNSTMDKDDYTESKSRNEAVKSISKKITGAFIPALIQNIDKAANDALNTKSMGVNVYNKETKETKEMLKLLGQRLPLDMPILRGTYGPKHPKDYSPTGFTTEWSNFQYYMRELPEDETKKEAVLEGYVEGMNVWGKKTFINPEGEIVEIMKQAIRSKAKTKEFVNGEFVTKIKQYEEGEYYQVADKWKELYYTELKNENIKALIKSNPEEALNKMKEISKKVQENPDFTIFKSTMFVN